MSEMPRTKNFQQATEIPQATPTAPVRGPARNTVRRAALALAFLAGTAAVVHYGHDYWVNGRYLETTDDAYVKADSTIIAPKVSGYIAKVLVSDNEKVKAGQLLAKIDDRDFKAALNQARADVAAAEAAVRNLDAQLELQQPIIEQSTADVAAAEAAVRNLDAQLELQQPIIEQSTADVAAADANLKFAQEERARYDDLMKSGSGTIQRAQQTDAALRASNAQLQHARSGLVAAQRKVDVLTTQRAQATAQLEHARAVAEQATLNLSYTEITAPVDGTVGARSLRVGQFVQAGTQLMAVVPLDAVYVVANFKETQLTHVRAGQPVELHVDSFRNQTLRGHVDSLSPASGLEFALLPPDNATGNFTKIVQRVPVKIVLDDHSLTGLLRPGMSAVPTVDTKQTVLAERETAKHLADNAARPNGG
jgi:membrane fusion protein (multidrug efflux system)